MLVIAGYRSDVSDVDTVDVLDLSDDETSSCIIVPDYPLEVRGLFGDLVDGVPKVCGGYDGGYYPNCFDYDPGLNAWVEAPPMMVPRYYAAASVIGDSWFVSGGSVSAALKDERLEWFGMQYGITLAGRNPVLLHRNLGWQLLQ